MIFRKTLADIIIIARIYYLQFRDQLGQYLFSGFLIPLGSFFMASATAGKEPSHQLRFFTGAILLSFSLLTIMWLGSILIEDRFYGRLKLFITAPISPISYVLGVLSYACILGLVTGLGFLVAARILGIPVQPRLLPVSLLAFLTLCTFAGIGVVLSQYAETLQAGGVLADAVSTMLIFLSPVYYPMETLPKGMQYLASLLPPTYAAHGITNGLAGKNGVGQDALALFIMSVVILAVALWSVRWREI